MEATIVILNSGLFVCAAYGDVRTRRIPNLLVLAIAMLALGRLILAGDPGAAAAAVGAAAAVFFVGFLGFWRGLWGGGDVKLLAATVLLIGHRALGDFLLVMSLFGLVVTLATLAAARLKPRAVMATPSSSDAPAPPTVPYGVAIAAAGILTLFLQSPSLV